MPRSPLKLVLRFALGLLAVQPVWAHGGVYQPPPNLPTGKTGLPNPATPPGYGGSPISGGPPSPGPSLPGTLGGWGGSGIDPTRWTWWWEFHRDPYLELRRHVLRNDSRTGIGGDVTDADPFGVVARPTPARIRDAILPALARALETSGNSDLQASALIAIGRVADDLDEVDRRGAADRIRPFLRDPSQELSEAAVLALGILGYEPSAPLLAALARDDAFARSVLDQTRVGTRMRAIAAFSLGLLAGESAREDVRRYAVHELGRVLIDERATGTGELEGACVLALGLVPLELEPQSSSDAEAPPSAGRRAQIAFLSELLLDRRRNDLVRAQVPLSLARLAAMPPGAHEAKLEELRGGVARDLLDRLAPMRREPNGVVQASIVGLGYLVDNDDDAFDAEARRRLRTIDSEQRDRGARHLARIALAQIAARDGTGHPDGVSDVRRFLLAELGGGRSDERAWAAIALGVMERGRIDAGQIPDPTVARALRSALSEQKAPDEVGASAIGLGLMRDPDAEPVLLTRLRGIQDDEARGQVALSLGMVGARASAAELQRLVDASAYRPLTLGEAASGLALLGDKGTLSRLLTQLKESRSLASQAALAQAIGRIGDARAFDALIELIGDTSVSSSGRAFAVVALGLAADLDPLPWSVPLAFGGNHLTAPVTLYDDLGLGVLNLL